MCGGMFPNEKVWAWATRRAMLWGDLRSPWTAETYIQYIPYKLPVRFIHPHSSTFKCAPPPKKKSKFAGNIPTFHQPIQPTFLKNHQRWGPHHSPQRCGEITVEAVNEDQGLEATTRPRRSHDLEG